MQEEWREIKGYEGRYSVSNFGRVKSLSRPLSNRSGSYRTQEIILKPQPNKKGYLRVRLFENNINSKTLFVHRLVAKTYITNPLNLPTVNHLDEIKTNNSVSNLEWCSYRDNNIYGTVRQRRIENTDKEKASRNRPKTCPKRRKPVLQLDLNGNLIKRWESISEATSELGFGSSSITNCCKGRVETLYKNKWAYAKEEII